jgi:hypothetical protein
MAAVTTQVDSFVTRAAADVAAGATCAAVHVFKITGDDAATGAATDGVLVTSPSGISFHAVLFNADDGVVTVEYSPDDDTYDVLGTPIAFDEAGARGVAAGDLRTGYYRLTYADPGEEEAKDIVVVMIAQA